MRPVSVYCFECLCGRPLESEITVLVCPNCQREITLEWPVRDTHEKDEPKETEEPPCTTTAAA
jgi:hypothetical protein